MSSFKELKKEKEITASVKIITNAYQELASLKMLKIRKFVLLNRDFLEKLAEIYFQIKIAHLSAALIPTDQPTFSFIGKIDKTALVYLSSNQLFYGPLVIETWKKVYNYSIQEECEIVIVGRVGKYLAESNEKPIKFHYFDLEEENPDKENIKRILEFIKNYKRIVVFHGKFFNISQQLPAKTEVLSGLPVSFDKNFDKKKIKQYLFEPSFKTVLEFFETEILEALFNQIIWEHQLAKSASRVIAMYQATENAEKKLHKLDSEIQKTQHQLFNKKQTDLISNYLIWKKN